MNTERILVVSGRPLLCEGLKLIIEEAALATVTTAPDEVSATRLVAEFAPSIIVIDRPDAGAADLNYLFQHQDYPVKVVVIGWNDNKIAAYSRRAVQTATLRNLIKVIRETKESSQATQCGKHGCAVETSVKRRSSNPKVLWKIALSLRKIIPLSDVHGSRIA